jgi:phage terminase large subunit
MFDVSPVWHKNYNSTADIVINQGGTDSGKTYAIIQILAFIGATHPIPNNGDPPVISVLSESIPNSKKGPYRIFEMLAHNNKYVGGAIKHWDRAGRVITFKTGWILEFLGVTDEQNAKQGKRQYLFVNEANKMPWLVFWQMAKRTRVKVWVDYNPTEPFWAHDKLIGTVPETNDLYKTVELIISDHRHNPFLTQKQHDEIENIRDPELWRVYARGLTGKHTGIIYPNWTIVPDNEFPLAWPKFGAIDFGYTNDPTAAIDMRMKKHDVFVHELCYEPGISNRAVKAMFRERGHGPSTPVYCEHDLATIREFRLMQVQAIQAVKGNVAVGIHRINKEFHVHVTQSSKNIIEEIKRYKWMLDPDTGLPTNEPIDAWNHTLDAIRYGIITHDRRKAA